MAKQSGLLLQLRIQNIALVYNIGDALLQLLIIASTFHPSHRDFVRFL